MAGILERVAQEAKAGISTAELDALAESLIRSAGDEPAFKGYKPDGARIPFPATLCVSINNEVVHGIPSADRILKEGDIVGLDLGLKHGGLFVDAAVTVGVGKIDERASKLINVTREALMVGIASARVGKTVDDVGSAIEKFVKPHKFGIVRELGGHGVGHAVHESPYVPNFSGSGYRDKLEEGMVIAIEPMLNEGGWKVKLASDKFTYRTTDGSRSAHFEHTIVITKTGPEILTKL